AAREAWLGSRAVARWWLDHRLVPNGELGGLVGDDSDMYQNWADLPLFESDGVGGRVKEAGARLMELAAAENLTGGLNRVTTDPLHAYEEGVNQLALMTFWSYGDPLYLERCFENARNTEALTVVTPAGHRHFRSQQISAQDITTPRPPEIDGEAHPLMWHPSLEVAWYNRSPAVLRRLDEWASGWLAHLEPGKNAESVEVATETARSVRPYALAGGYGSQATTFASLYLLTGDLKYLQPWLAEWQRSGWSRQGSVVLQEFAELLPAGALGPKERDCQRANPITCYRLHGDKAPLIQALRRDVAELQRFGAMYTSAEVFTDRVFLYPLLNPARCYLGGEWTRNSFTRDHAVSWSGFGTDYAALVQTNRPDRLRVLLYNFAAEPLRGEARVWRLSHGRYSLRLGPDHNGDDRLDQVAVEHEMTLRRGDRLPLTLPPGVVTVLELEQTAALENLFERPDLALAPRDLRTDAGGVTCRVHNLGAATAPASKVALLDAQGHLLATAVAPPIEAPLDLAPHSVQVILGVAPPTGPWRVAIDPDDAIAEINEANNAADAP
ncbi:MAG: hypothetical protein HUU35_01390, partial [Armatimonadetes bacterium]|nr:hypothetical protein [Armatimonadota bacterium]